VAAGRLSLGGRSARLNKRKRVRPGRLITNKYLVAPTREGNRLRAPYFKHYRAERWALSLLENTFSKTDNRKTYRANRYLYYFVIPHLARCLWFEPDRDRLRTVEIDLFNELLSYSFRRGRHKEPDRVRVWSFRFPTVDDGQHSESSKEPRLFQDLANASAHAAKGPETVR